LAFFSQSNKGNVEQIFSMDNTLLVLAAGMGSRYGGLKQMDGLGPSGETILDYSVFDAIRSGFTRVVFVIRRDFEDEFRVRVGSKFESRIGVDYVFQQLSDLPEGFTIPAGRERPWGTGHAVWAARHAIDTPFLAINADDFYGYGAISTVADFLSTTEENTSLPGFCLAGYRLDATLSEHGTVSRGVCRADASNQLVAVREQTRIAKTPQGICDESDGAIFVGTERVSMNCWGFTPKVFGLLDSLLIGFLESHGNEEKSEFYIPAAVTAMIDSGGARVRVLPVESNWFGVTYKEDRPIVVDALATLILSGDYPSPLK
jgi:NDP-sugar pyrophosphorylase family protein